MKIFKEEQKFTQAWLHILITIGAISPITIIVSKWMNAADKGLAANTSSLISILTIIAVHFLIYSAKLTTRIDEYGIHYQLFPFHLKSRKILWNDVEDIFVRNYNPILEYGGWGLRFTLSKRKGIAVNIRGDIGIQLVLKNGKKLLIGTQKEEDVKRVLETYKNQ